MISSHCEFKTGLFVLRPCGRAPRYACNNCQKSVCSRHSGREGDYAYCLECLAEIRRHKRENEDDYEEDFLYDDLWYYHARSEFYTAERYSPLDASDVEGFQRQAGDQLYEDNDLGSFFDS